MEFKAPQVTFQVQLTITAKAPPLSFSVPLLLLSVCWGWRICWDVYQSQLTDKILALWLLHLGGCGLMKGGLWVGVSVQRRVGKSCSWNIVVLRNGQNLKVPIYTSSLIFIYLFYSNLHWSLTLLNTPPPNQTKTKNQKTSIHLQKTKYFAKTHSNWGSCPLVTSLRAD